MQYTWLYGHDGCGEGFRFYGSCFLLQVLKVYGFGKIFINWIRIILTNQESCVMNGGNSTGYFKLERGARQGDPISAYLFILVIEVFFQMI